MIHLIGSDLSTFKALKLKPGLNILLADKSAGSTDKQTRNGAGKTSLVELLHFIFAGSADKNNVFRNDALSQWHFDVQFDLSGKNITASRSGGSAKNIKVTGDCGDFCLQPELHKNSGDQIYTAEQWSNMLGHEMFDLKCWQSENDDRPKFSPTFRMLFPYFVRRQYAGGFLDPHRNSENQQPWDQRVALSYLLGLDESIPGKFEVLGQREKDIKTLKKMAKDGNLELLGSAGDFRTKLAIAEEKADRLKKRVASFHVVDQYKDMEREASSLTREIQKLNDENVEDELLLAQLKVSLSDETPPSTANLMKLYEEAGVVFPQNITRRFEEVETFHKVILQNRKTHLSGEIEATQARIKDRDAQKKELDRRRAEIMNILKSGGALEHFLLLQEEAGRIESEVATFRKKLELAEQIESTKAALGVDRAQLTLALQNDHKEREDAIKRAVLAFEQLSESLYVNERAGNLIISPGKNGLDLEIKIDGERSKGISNMQIFCFDLMLMQICHERNMGPGFLVHDSHLFDGVDERQVAKALQIGAERSEKLGFQYFVTMNSDALPKEGFDEGFNLQDHILPVRLTDESEMGGLFGVRF